LIDDAAMPPEYWASLSRKSRRSKWRCT
jgi:hypothetical protein